VYNLISKEIGQNPAVAKSAKADKQGGTDFQPTLSAWQALGAAEPMPLWYIL